MERIPRNADLTGRRLGEWTVLRMMPRTPGVSPQWLCRCSCGVERVVFGHALKGGRSRACSRHAVDLTGKRFGSWTVTGVHSVREGQQATGVRNYTTWSVICDCGTRHAHTASTLRSGHTMSCGCSRFDAPRAAILAVMRSYRKNATARGLAFALTKEQFVSLTLMCCDYCGTKPLPRKNGYAFNGIDRIDNSLGYTTENCVACCRRCNWAKSTMGRDEFLDWVNAVSVHQRNRPAGAAAATLATANGRAIPEQAARQSSLG